MINTEKINQLLKQTSHHDNDERYMATSDLTAELSAVDGLLDVSLQVPIRNAIMRQLNDKSIDVQAVAVKCLATCVQKFHTEQVVGIVEKMAHLIVEADQKQESRDIYAIGLKTIMTSVREADGAVIADRLVVALLTGLKVAKGKADNSLILMHLDILKEVIGPHGGSIGSSHGSLMEELVPLLEHQHESIRKRTSLTVGTLVKYLSEPLFLQLMQAMVSKLEDDSTGAESLETYIQTISVISVHAGVRVGKYLPSIVPKLIGFCQKGTDDDEQHDEKKMDLWEDCLQALESVIIRCPDEVTPFVQEIVDLCFDRVEFDPNYSYDVQVDDDEDDGDWGDDDDDELFEDEEEDHQDDDSSWKVRRAAVRTLDAFITTRSDMLRDYYDRLADHLTARFKERDDNVKVEILKATSHLLQEAVVSGHGQVHDELGGALGTAPPRLVRQRSSYSTLVEKVGDIVTACSAQLEKVGHVATKKAVFEVVRELLVVCRSQMTPHLDTIVPHIVEGVKSKDATLRTDCLSLLLLLLQGGVDDKLGSHVSSITAAVALAAKDGYTKNRAEALRVATALVRAVDPTEHKEVVDVLFPTTYETFLLTDMDQEVKATSITTMACFLSHFGHSAVVQADMKNCLPVFVERLSNEVTRLPALRAVAYMADSHGAGKQLIAPVSLQPIMTNVLGTLFKFLKQQSQTLRHEAVKALDSLVRSHGKTIDDNMFSALLKEVTGHINDSDLFLSHLVLDLVSSVFQVHGATDDEAAKALLEKLCAFLRSPLLQGAALQSLIRLFQVITSTKSALFTYDSLLQSLLALVSANLPRPSLVAIAQCNAAMALQQSNISEIVDGFVKLVQSKDDIIDELRQVHLLTVGEIGRQHDLSSHNDLELRIFDAFAHPADEVQMAASHALGNISVGNVKHYVPTLLKLIAAKDGERYHLLMALKEVILSHTHSNDGIAKFKPFVDNIVPVLTDNAERKDEGVRSMVAECLGRLAIIDQDKLVPQMKKMATSESAFSRGVVIAALRFAVRERDTSAATAASASPAASSDDLPPSNLLRTQMPAFLELLRDKDLAVQRQSTVTVNALIHNAIGMIDPKLIKDIICPVLYQNTVQNKDLIRVVDYGPFKQKEDDGLPLRKASFQCLETLLVVAPHRLDLKDFVEHIKKGVVDPDDDVQIVTYQIFYNMALYHGNSLLQVLDTLPGPIKDSVRAKLKAAKGDKPERAKTVLRTAVRALYAMSRITGVHQCKLFHDFYRRVLKTALLSQMLNELKAERAA